MRKLSLVLVAALSTAIARRRGLGPAHAKPPKPKAELVVKGLAATYADGQVTVSASVKNKGTQEGQEERDRVLVSPRTARRARTTRALGTLATSEAQAQGDAEHPGAPSRCLPGLQPGAYRADRLRRRHRVVKERKEKNNCKASTVSVTLPGGPPPPGKVNVSATATTGGTVAASGVTGGTCTGTFCTLTSGAGAVTFTPTAAAGYRFGGWSGCTGFTGTTAITFTNPTASQACTATFVQAGDDHLCGVASLPVRLAARSPGWPRTAPAPPPPCSSRPGSCVVDAGVGTVTLTASPLLPLLGFSGWSGATCDGTAAANVMTFTAPATDKACTANFL